MKFLKCKTIPVPPNGFAGYLASPYSHLQIEVRNMRVRRVANAVFWFMQRGLYLYSPIVYTDLLCKLNSPDDYTVDSWLDFDKSIIQSMPCFYILVLKGWKKSKGIKIEYDYAKLCSKPIRFVEIKDTNPTTYEICEKEF